MGEKEVVGALSFTIVDIIFIVLSVVAVSSALLLVVVRDLFRAAIAFVVTLLSLAGIFILLNAEFIGAIQILVNVGAVAILLVVTIMLIRDLSRGSRPTQLVLVALGFGVAVLTATIIALGVIDTEWVALLADNPRFESAILGEEEGVLSDTVGVTGRLLLREFVLIFEILGVIIAAAIVGAIAVLHGVTNDGDLQEQEERA